MTLSHSLDPVSIRAKRLLYRSCNRGCKETDLLLGRFATACIYQLSETELDEYEQLIEESDADIFAWLTGKLPVPDAYQGGVIERVKNWK